LSYTDTNRKNTDADRPVRRLECVRIAAKHSAFLPQIAREICGVDFGLKAYEVVMTHGRNEVFMIRKRRQNLICGLPFCAAQRKPRKARMVMMITMRPTR
jgi:hypothetical protein